MTAKNPNVATKIGKTRIGKIVIGKKIGMGIGMGKNTRRRIVWMLIKKAMFRRRMMAPPSPR